MDLLLASGSAVLFFEVAKCARSLVLRFPSTPAPSARVRTTLIVPFKGLEPGLEAHARAFAAQPATEIFFVLDTLKDPAYPILKKIRGVRILTAPSIPGASGKCSALLAGVKHAKGDILVFGDSDSLAQPTFLDSLVAPLASPGVGATTGYRWYVPKPGNIASLMKSAWDDTGLNLQVSRAAFVWGGSYALRMSDWKAWGLADAWRTTISDDTAVTAAVKEHDKKIQFAPGAMVTSTAQTSWRDLLEFTNRQVFMVRNFAKEGWLAGLVVYGWNVLLLALFALSLARGHALASVLVFLSFGGAAVRSFALRRLYHSIGLHRAYMPALFAFPARILMVVNLLHASRARSVTWRGRTYQRSSRTQ